MTGASSVGDERGAGTAGGASGSGGAVWWNRAALAGAIGVSGMLAVAAYAKWTGPNKGKTLFGNPDVLQDQVIAVVEVVIIVALLAGHRLKLAWMALVLMFGGFAGYAGHYFSLGESCGCFGQLIELPSWGTLVIDLTLVALGFGMLLGRRVKLGVIAGLLVGAVAMSGVGWVFADATYQTPEEIEKQIAAELEDERGDEPGSVVTDAGGAEDSDRSGAAAASELPGRADGPTAMERLLRSELLAGARGADAMGKAWYVFVYDPDCHVCEEKLIDVGAFEAAWGGDHFLVEVVTLTKREIEDAAGIRYSAWDGSPVVFVVQDGRVVRVSRNEEAETPQDVADALDFGTFEVNFPPGG